MRWQNRLLFQPYEELRVTLDTKVLDSQGLETLSHAANDQPIEIAVVTVSERESGRPFVEFRTLLEGAVWDESEWRRAVGSGPIKETLLLDESRLGGAVLGSDTRADLLDSILTIITNGSFPKRGERDQLSDPQRRQLRDAMILEAHARHQRDIFVTKDERGFIRNGRRAQLEQLRATRILTNDELLDICRRRGEDA
jgi:hypothetical protein